MEDSGNDFQPSKKRAAGVQLSRDNAGLGEDEETSEQPEGGTFKRASDEVLSSRRIVKVRRKPASSIPTDTAPAPTSNPFAAIRLAPSTESAPSVEVEAVTSKETEQINKNDVRSDNKVDNISDGIAKQSESIVDESKPESVAEKDKTDEVVCESKTKSVVEEVAEGENSDGATTETGNEVESKGNDKEKDDVEATTEDNAQTASFSSFQQLSSGQNAFSGFAGTGSSNSAFSFGSIPIDGSTTTGSQHGFSFGVSKNGNSSLFGASNQNEGSKFPSMSEVPLETGEENEKAVFTANSVLFEYVDGLWKERGKGELKVNISTTETGKARLVMRARGNYRLILNASIFPDMKLTNMEKKDVTFACVNSAAEGKDGLSTIALKFKDASIAEEFKASVMEHKGKASVDLKTPENSPKVSEE